MIVNIGCNTENKDFKAFFNSIDNYLIEVDMKLCSEECPCYFKYPQNYLNNISIASEYSMWSKTTQDLGAISYANCNDKVKNDVQAYIEKTNNYTGFNLNQTDFISFYKIIESNFYCTGFCKILYTNKNDNLQHNMVKYLFSDLSMYVK